MFALLDFLRSFCAPRFFALIIHARASIYDQDRTARKGHPEQDMQNRTARTGQPERDRQNKTARTGQPGHESQDRTDRNITGRTGKAEQDGQTE